MIIFFGLLLTLLPFFADSQITDPIPKLLYDVALDFKPAFCSVLDNKELTAETGVKSYDIGVSSFTGNINRKDTTYSVNDVHNFKNVQDFDLNLLTDDLVWPNEVEQVPDGVFDRRVWSVASAFFLAGKDNGSIALIDVKDKANPETFLITPQEEKLWFYHRVLWEDMNGDGHLDAVTARAYGTGDAATEAQLIWLENPGLAYPTSSWNYHVIYEGVEDIAFRIHKLKLSDGTMTSVVISAGFWSKELGLTWSETNDWFDAGSIRHIAVDKFGMYFDLEIVDLNQDGRLDILCTTWSQVGGFPGALLGYEIPDNWQDESSWTRHIIQDGYTEFPFYGFGSPGTAMTFWPSNEMKTSGMKPWIVISGDDNGEAYIVTPDSNDAFDWSYKQSLLFKQLRGTVGKIAVGDVDDDGYADLFLPSYENQFLRVMTYAP